MIRTLTLFFVLLFLGACADKVSTEEYITRAKAAMAQSELPAATIELKNALRQDPNSAQARWLLGKIHVDTGDIPSARKELEQALDLGWPPDDIQPVLARLLLLQGEFDLVAGINTDGLTPDAQSTLFSLQAQAALSLGKTEEARELVDKAIALKPDATDVLIAKAHLLISGNDLDGALVALDQVISVEPKRAEAWSLRGDILAQQQDFKGAMAAYDKAIQHDKTSASDLFKRALLKVHLGEYESAQRDANKLLQKKRKHPGSNYVQGLLHFQAGRYDEAVSSLSVTEPAFKQYPLSLYFLSSANIKLGNFDMAVNQAERFYSLSPNSVQGRKLLSVIRLQQNDYTDVITLLQPVVDSNPDDVEALNLMSNALLRDGKTSEAVELLARVAELEPDSPTAQVRLGAGLLMGGRGDAAVKPIETALELDPNAPMADILLVLNHLQKKDYAAAIATAEAYRSRNPDNVTPYNLLGRIYLQEGNAEKARESFKHALTIDKADPGANHYLAQMALADNDIPAARQYYETTLTEHKDSLPTILQLAVLDSREGNEKAMVARLEQAMTVAPTSLQPRLVLARYYLSQGKPSQIAPLFTNLDSEQQQTPEVLQIMALAQLSTKDPGAAQYSLEQLLNSTEDSAPIRHLMALAAAEEGNVERTREELKRAIALDENYIPSRIALARLSLASKEAAEFEQQLKQLVKLAPENPEVILLQASAADGRGDTAAAVSLAKKAFKLAPKSAALVALAGYEEAGGDRPSALKRYSTWLQEHPGDVPARLAYASSLMANQQEAQASEQYTVILETDANNLMALNNQAWLLREKAPVQALEYAQKAATLAPDSAAVLDTLAVVEYNNKEYDQAQRSILRALKAAPDDPSMRYHSAMIAAALKDKSSAIATLEKLLAANSSFPEAAEARALLAQLQ